MPHDKKAETEDIINLYIDGFSCQKIGKIFDMSRQAVWARLKRNNIELRKLKKLPFVMYDGMKFTINKNGYYRATRRDKHISLHRYKYEKKVGKIPEGFDIHHIDNNKTNNDIENLECLCKSEHTRKYSPHHNQYKNNKTIQEGVYEN